MKYPMLREIRDASPAQLEAWFLGLPRFTNRTEEIKWVLISSRYYMGVDPGPMEGETYGEYTEG
jgi:hypothetical protein